MQLRHCVLPAVVLGMVVAGCGTGTEPVRDPAGQQPANHGSHGEHGSHGDHGEHGEHGNGGDDSADRKARATAADVQFARMMIPHHEQAIEMAEMVEEKKAGKDLVELANNIESAQQPEIDQLTAMLEGWGEDVPGTTGAPSESGGGHAGHAGDQSGDHGDVRDGDRGGDRGGAHTDHDEMAGIMSEKQMQALRRADGREFERIWLTMMVRHHEGAVTMSEELLAEGADTEARKLARQIIDAQDAEIDQMNRMLDRSGS